MGGGGERCWVIEDEQLGRLAVPQSWTRIVEEAGEPGTKPPEVSGPELPLSDSQRLRALAKLVETLQNREKEVAYDTRDETANDQDNRALEGADNPTAGEIEWGTGLQLCQLVPSNCWTWPPKRMCWSATAATGCQMGD